MSDVMTQDDKIYTVIAKYLMACDEGLAFLAKFRGVEDAFDRLHRFTKNKEVACSIRWLFLGCRIRLSGSQLVCVAQSAASVASNGDRKHALDVVGWLMDRVSRGEADFLDLIGSMTQEEMAELLCVSGTLQLALVGSLTRMYDICQDEICEKVSWPKPKPEPRQRKKKS